MGPFKTAGGHQRFVIRLRCAGACWAVQHTYKAFVGVDAQLRGAAEPAAEPPLHRLPELPQAGSGVLTTAQSKHATRLVALQSWVQAVLDALQGGRLATHAPLCVLLELHTPFVVRLQAHVRRFVRVRAFARERRARAAAVAIE